MPKREGSLIFIQIEPSSSALKKITASEDKKFIKASCAEQTKKPMSRECFAEVISLMSGLRVCTLRENFIPFLYYITFLDFSRF